MRNYRIAAAAGRAYLATMQHAHYATVAAAIRYLLDHQDEQPDLREVAAAVHLSKYHFQRVFQEYAGVTPKQFLQHITLGKAREKLRAGQSTLSTSLELGFSSNSRLHDLFVKIEGCTPGAFGRRGAGAVFHYGSSATPFGPALIAETERGLSRLAFLPEGGNPGELLRSEFPEARLVPELGPYGRRVVQFFADWATPDSPIPLDLRGTPFQLAVWRALLALPENHFLSYGDIARRIGNPRSVRAVGTAVGANPIAYLIPCHRVIRASGAAGGYRWGLERKAAINALEAVRSR